MKQTVYPFIAYEDAGAAMDWLARVFGFRETLRMQDEQERVVHGELELNGGTVLVASPTPDYQSPGRHAQSCEAARRWMQVPWVIDGVLVYVEDVDVHFRRSSAEGAAILSQIEEGGAGRQYRAADLEGHRWMFAQPRKG